MKEKLVVIDREKEGRAGTLLIAKGFGRRHEQITRLIKKYQSEFEDLNTLRVFKVKGKGRSFDEYWLTESQFLFLGTLFKNSDIVVKFKLRLVKEFDRIKKQLAAVQAQKSDQKWIMSRDFGKEQRLEATDSIKEFVEYAKSQGSRNAEQYFAIITRMANGLLFLCGDKFKNLREVLTAKQLMIIANAEQIISKGLRDGMKAKTFYKDIYQDVKQKVLDFAGLTGQTEVIEEQIKLEE